MTPLHRENSRRLCAQRTQLEPGRAHGTPDLLAILLSNPTQCGQQSLVALADLPALSLGSHLGLENGFLHTTQVTKEKLDTLNFIKIKNLCPSKDTIKKVKRLEIP